MTVTTKNQGLWTWTRITALKLPIAALAILAILPVRQGADAGFALVVGALLLITAGLVRRFRLPAHVWAAVIRFLLLLMFGAYTIADISRRLDNVGVFIIDVVAAIGGGITLFAVRYLLVVCRLNTVTFGWKNGVWPITPRPLCC